jgi:hypothetical protein
MFFLVLISPLPYDPLVYIARDPRFKISKEDWRGSMPCQSTASDALLPQLFLITIAACEPVKFNKDTLFSESGPGDA